MQKPNKYRQVSPTPTWLLAGWLTGLDGNPLERAKRSSPNRLSQKGRRRRARQRNSC